MGRTSLLAVLLLAAAAGPALPQRSQALRVTAVRHWSLGGVTRIAVEVSGDFEYHSERLHNPERVFFDIVHARPAIDGKRAHHEEVGDRLVSKVRIAETVPGTTRVVVDLAAPAVFTASRIGNPSRLVIELREAPSAPAVPVVEAAAPAAVKPAEAPAEPGTPGAAPAITRKSAPEQVAKTAPPALAFPRKPVPEPAAAAPISGPISDKPPLQTAPAIAAAVPPVLAVPVKPLTTTPPPEPLASAKPVPSASAALAETGAAATRKSDGKNSLIRALGLKINRVVIDPGHGGHDQGTMGKRGLIEKELVLDVGKRLGALIEQQLGCEVVYTRSDDTFVPLEGRTALANEKKADLFISLHANSSSYARIAGVETFFLNFTTARDALDVAARENASSQKSISELQDLLQRIARQEKIEESKELAGRIQTAMFTFSSRYNPGIRNRGVKRAPFVVLVGAQMPSVLVEIGFLSNSREETLLKRPDHRQRVAEALLKGVSRYTQSLSHFQVAQAGQQAGQ